MIFGERESSGYVDPVPIANSLLIVLVLFVSACAGSGSAKPATTAVPTTVPPPMSSTTTLPGPTTTLPGQPNEAGPQRGDRLLVIGISHDEHLNLRASPGTSSDVIARIPADHAALTALGNTRDVDGGMWVEVDFEGTVGWAHLGYIGLEGTTDDLTAYVIDQVGDRPSAPSMAELGEAVAAALAPEEPKPRIVKVVEETVGDPAEVTYDVVGLGDDALGALRVHVIAEPFDGGFTLRTVEVTYVCGRGLTAGGLCA